MRIRHVTHWLLVHSRWARRTVRSVRATALSPGVVSVAVLLVPGCRDAERRAPEREVPEITADKVRPTSAPASVMRNVAKPAEIVVARGATHGFFDEGCLYWFGADALFRRCEETARIESLLQIKNGGPAIIRDGVVFMLRSVNGLQSTLSSFDTRTRKQHELTTLQCSVAGTALTWFGTQIVVGGDCNPEFSLITTKGGKRPWLPVTSESRNASGALPNGLAPEFSAVGSSMAWMSQGSVFLTDLAGNTRKQWGPHDATALALNESELFWAHGRTSPDAGADTTNIDAVVLQSNVMRTLISGLGHVCSMSLQRNRLYFTEEPSILAQVDTETGAAAIIGNTPPGVTEVVPGSQAIYVLSATAGVFAYQAVN